MDSGKISESQKEDRHLRLQSDILSELLLVAVSCVIEYDAALSVVGAVRATATIWADSMGPGKMFIRVFIWWCRLFESSNVILMRFSRWLTISYEGNQLQLRTTENHEPSYLAQSATSEHRTSHRYISDINL